MVKRWNKVLEKAGRDERLTLPSRRFNRQIGIYSKNRFDPAGNLVSEAEWAAKHESWVPSSDDKAFITHLQYPVTEPGKIANWIAPPAKGIKDKPFEFEYVRRA